MNENRQVLSARTVVATTAQILLFLGSFLVCSRALREVVPPPREYGIGDKIRHFEQHRDEYDLVLFGSSLTHRALIPSIIEEELAGLGLLPPVLSPEVLESSRVYRALEDETDPEYRQRRIAFEADPSPFHRRVASMLRREEEADPIAEYNVPALERQVSLFLERGIDPIYVVPPGSRSTPRPQRLHQNAVLPRLLSYHRPREHPFLFEASWHFDESHLSREGAERFSRIFARDLARFLEPAGEPD